MALVLSTFLRLSKCLIDETKCMELQSTSLLNLDRNSLLESKRCILDYSNIHTRVLALDFKVEEMVDDAIKLLIVDAYQSVQIENMEIR